MAKLAFNFGDRWKNLNQLPTIEHNLFFQYLVISPSYWAAHLVRVGQIELSDKSLPKDIKSVLKTYDLFGDIFTTPFEMWWEERGCGLFYTDTNVKTLNIAIDITRPKYELLKQVELKISKAQARSKMSSKPKAFLLVNKIHAYSLFEKLNLVELKANAYKNGVPGKENWRIAAESSLRSKWKKGLDENAKLTARNEKARAYLGMLVSKNLSEALTVAENAARGRFPLKEQSAHHKKFDFAQLGQLLFERFIEEVQFMHDASTQDRPIKHHDYANAMIKQINKKMRSRKRFEKAIDDEIARREREAHLPLD
jgi:hypothetical protein